MKVKELIEELKKLNQEGDVRTRYEDGYVGEVYMIDFNRVEQVGEVIYLTDKTFNYSSIQTEVNFLKEEINNSKQIKRIKNEYEKTIKEIENNVE